MDRSFKVKYDDFFKSLFVSLFTLLFGQERDMTILVTGKVGSGKSTLGMQCAVLARVIYDKAFDLRKDMVYYPDYNQIKQRVLEKDDYAPIVIDEAIRSVYKMSALTTDARKLKILLDICRKRRKVLIFCLPKIQDFSSLMIDRVALWIHVVYRDKTKGIAAVFVPSGNFLQKTQWDLTMMAKTFDRKVLKGSDEVPVYSDLKNVTKDFSKFPNFAMAFEFYPLPKQMYAEYLQIADELLKDHAEAEDIKEQESVLTTRTTSRLQNVIGTLYYEEGKTQEEILNLLQISSTTLAKYMRIYRKANDISPEEHKRIIAGRIGKANKTRSKVINTEPS